MTDRPRVGFVGLGSQGGPMAQRIVDGGFPTTVWARRPEQARPFADSGAAVAATPAELGAASDVLCVCVVADRDVDAVLRGSSAAGGTGGEAGTRGQAGTDGALAWIALGSVVVVHSTVHPDTCRRLQADHPAIHIVDAPVSGGGHKAASRELLVMVGGSPDAVERCRPVLDTFADPLVHLGPLGAGQEAKLLNNALFAAQLGLAADAYATAVDRGLDPGALATVLAAGSGRSYAAELVARDQRLAAMAQFAGELLAKDVGILADLLAPGRPGLIDAAAAAVTTMRRATATATAGESPEGPEGTGP